MFFFSYKGEVVDKRRVLYRQCMRSVQLQDLEVSKLGKFSWYSSCQSVAVQSPAFFTLREPPPILTQRPIITCITISHYNIINVDVYICIYLHVCIHTPTSHSYAFTVNRSEVLQKSEVGKLGQGWRDRPSKVVVVKIQAHKALQSSKFIWYCPLQFVHVQLPVYYTHPKQFN